MIRRREFITLLGGAAASWPVEARAQQRTMPKIGFLTSLGKSDRPHLAAAWRSGLSEAGYVDGRNLVIEYRYAENNLDRLPGLVSDLVNREVVVIAATANTVSFAKNITTTIPLIFTTGGDPVQEKYVSSLDHPGGNVTGVSWFSTLSSSKSLSILHELLRPSAVIAILASARLPETNTMLVDAREAANRLGRQLQIFYADTPAEIDAAFVMFRSKSPLGLFVGGGPFFTARVQQIIALATHEAIPAIYTNREFVDDGGLISYGNDISDAYRRAGNYVGRVLKGEKVSDLPVDRATKFETVLNLKTARALGITVPATLLARADEVIE